MTAAWPEVLLGEVLGECNTSVPASSLDEVNLAGVYSFGRGLFKRGPMSPGKTSYKTYNRLVVDDFVISMPKAWEGALARVTPEFDGWYLSPVFPCFRANREQLEPSYLEWFCRRRQTWADLLSKAHGIGARRESVSPEQFLSLAIPLPPLPEQRRIVARIEELAGKREEAARLSQAMEDECDALCRSLVFCGKDSIPTPMAELVDLRPPDVMVEPEQEYEFAGVYCFGRGVFRGNRKKGMEFSYRQLTRVHAGEFLYPKLMAWEGALAVVPPELDGLYVSPEFPVFTVKQERVLPDVLDVYFRTPSVWPSLGGASTGTNVRRRRLNPQSFLDYVFPLPSMQRQIQLRSVRGKADELKRLQAETQAELDALMPSILDRAFKGDL